MKNIKRSHFLLLATVVCGVLYAVPAGSMRPPPVRLTEQQVTPSCIKTIEFYATGQPLGWGTGQKGTAVKIKNDCAYDIVIEDVFVSTKENAVKRPLERLNIHTQHAKGDGITVYKTYLYAEKEETCTSLSEELRLEREKNEKEIQAIQRMLEKNTLSSKDPYSKRRRERAELSCGSFPLMTGASAVIPVPWDTRYVFSGYSAQSEIRISGKVINPEDPTSSDVLALAEAGDAESRWQMASYYLYTEQKTDLALRWIRELAEGGHVGAQRTFSECYAAGKCGLAKDIEEAYFWHYVAAFRRHPRAPYEESKARKLLSAGQAVRVEERARVWMEVHKKAQSSEKNQD